jgi:hypothetical protein
MLDDAKFFPVLNRDDWRGKGSCVSRPLLAMPGSLLVGYGVVNADSNEYLTRKALAGSGKTIEEIEAIAMANLVKRENRAPWKRMKTEAGTILTRTGDELTAADLLAPAGMRKAHEFFKAENIYVAVPNRFVMIASEDLLSLTAAAASMYDEALTENQSPLTSDVLVFAAGVPCAIASQQGRRDAKPGDTSAVDPLLVAAPLVVALMSSDQQLGDKEANALRVAIEQELAEPRNSTVETLLQMFAANPEAASAPIQEQPLMEVAMSLAASLHRNLSQADLADYLGFLRELADKVAASSGGFLGFGKASRKERKTIAAMFRLFENPLMAEVLGAADDREDG